jgi:hypothetical protein
VPNKLTSYSNWDFNVNSNPREVRLPIATGRAVVSRRPISGTAGYREETREFFMMEPRLKSSVQWTPFPEELKGQIADVMNTHFADYDFNGRFVIDGAIYPSELILRIGLTQNGQLRQDNFEVSMEYSSETDKPIDLIHTLVDFLGPVWETFLEDEPERTDLPSVWTVQRFEKYVLYMRYTSVNTELEKQADEILKMYEKKLVHELSDTSANDFISEDDHNEHSCENPDHLH